jgi:NAD(P)H-binding
MARLVVLYGIGGLSDVGRHAILAALEQPTVEHVTIITEYPDLLSLPNWECGCPEGHTNPCEGEYASKIDLICIDSWEKEQPDLEKHFKDATGVISCLGHRQPGVKNKELITRGLVAASGNRQLIQAMKNAGLVSGRVVVCSSLGMGENIHWASKLMKLFFWTNTRKAYKDLLAMEEEYVHSDLDSLFIRPTGLGEKVAPCGEHFTQEKNIDDTVGLDLAKMGCARYLVQEALHPTRSRAGIVVGSRPASQNK